MTVIIITVLTGWLSAYCLNPTVGTIAYQQEVGRLPDRVEHYEVFLAVEDCSLVGQEATLIAGGETYAGIVFDCAGVNAYDKEGVSWMRELGVAAEVDWWFWQAHPELIGVEQVQVIIEE